MHNNTIILLASKGTGVGKSFLAWALKAHFGTQASVLSFASNIRKDISVILNNKGIDGVYFSVEKYNQIKNKPTNMGIGYDIILRNLICDHSDLIQKHFGETIWAELLSSQLTTPITIIDDWRREIESNYLITHSNSRVIKVYLEKEDINNNSDNSYEKQINPSNCDFHFILKKDRSNFDNIKNEIITSINK
jgi:hypothetical protein